MKYIAIIIASLLCGFFSGYLLVRHYSTPDGLPILRYTELKYEELRQDAFTPGENVFPSSSPANKIAPTDFAQIENQASVFEQLYSAYHLAAQADINQLESLLEKSIQSKDPLYSFNLTNIFLERYTALDPNRAIKYVSNSTLDQHQSIAHIVTSWIRHDPMSAMLYLRSISNEPLKIVLGKRLLADPTRKIVALREELQSILGAHSGRMAEQTRIAQLTPARAFEEALTKTGRLRMQQLVSSIKRWTANDPAAVLTKITLLENTQERQKLLQVAISQYLQYDPEAALSYVLANHPENNNLEQQVLSGYAKYDIDLAIPLVESYITRTGNHRILSNILAHWVQKDPTSALDYATNIADQQKHQIYQHLAFSYLNSHPTEAFNWVLGLDAQYQNIKFSALQNINSNNIAAAESVVRVVEPTKLRERLITSIARHKAQLDPNLALDWLAEYEAEPGYKAALQSIITTWSRRDPATAAKQIEAHSGQNGLQAIAGRVAQNWYQKNPIEALNWLEALPAGSTKSNAIAATSGLVAQKDPDAAVNMLVDIENGPAKNNALRSIAYIWTTKEPERIEEIISNLQLNTEDANRIRRRHNRAQPATAKH
ncbi:MAG: hypothetical protein KUG79_15195 [Pseudomonadales bacterium]|nr:hypothetical protein [Pseudomonadales bacterium]